ncbi:MAG: cytochrome c maturation protein CcmE [Myxococcota bacterium]|nr:cytochrome c maturation protein CcmE [Myxococcota bacterium]
MKPQVRNQLAALLALSIAGGVVGYLAYADIGENLVYFWSVEELLDKGDDALGATVRLGGVVQPETLKWDAETVDLKFNISMLPSKDDPIHVTVHAIGAPPQMFREGIGVVVEGKYDGKTFHADRVIVKHSNEYRPPAEGEKPEQLYETLMTNGS